MKFDLLVSSYHYDKFLGCACVFMCGCSPHVNSIACSISMIQSTPKKRNMIIAKNLNTNSTKFGVSKFSQQKNIIYNVSNLQMLWLFIDCQLKS